MLHFLEELELSKDQNIMESFALVSLLMKHELLSNEYILDFIGSLENTVGVKP